MTPDEHEALVRACQAVVAEIQARTSGCWAESLLPDLFAAYQQLLNAESWMVDRTCCARMLDSQYAETVRAEKAEEQRDHAYALIRNAFAESATLTKERDEVRALNTTLVGALELVLPYLADKAGNRSSSRAAILRDTVIATLAIAAARTQEAGE